nr:unnamed protein product [Callosobruchus chinensis]
MAMRRLYDLAMQEDSSEEAAVDVKRAQTESYNTASFTRVVGAIDCTHNCYRKSLLDSGMYGNSVMVGDSGYRCNKYMMTPLDNLATPAEHLYNEAQIRTRNSIEGMFGIWKRRFPVLALGMRVDLHNVFPIAVATAVLHNLSLNLK